MKPEYHRLQHCFELFSNFEKYLKLEDDFFHADSRDFMYVMNRVYSLYPRQIKRVICNHLDTHDAMRALTRCGHAGRPCRGRP